LLTEQKHDHKLLAAAASVVSLGSFLYYFQTGQILLYGDAVAHLHIARRVFDSLTPGPVQLGTVWLPLPHLLTIPLVACDALWKNGTAGSFPSMLAYVLGTLGMYRLGARLASRAAGWLAAATYAANPNLIYLQATAMTESIYLAAMIWSVVCFAEWALARRFHDAATAGKWLIWMSLALTAAIMTRYDGWLLALALGAMVLYRFWRDEPDHTAGWRRPLRNFILLTASTPALWMAYNYGSYKNPIEFATGPYSARGIAERTTKKGDPPYPGHDSPMVASLYFIKAAKLNVAEGPLEYGVFTLALLGAFVTAALRPRRRTLLALWIPLPFYALSIAYGGVPIFLPPWWPHSYYNVRYGIELLPAIAISAALLVNSVSDVRYSRKLERTVWALGIALIVISYAGDWYHTPISLREGRVNARTRMAFEAKLAGEIAKLPSGSRLLMVTGDHVGALQQLGFHLNNVVNEGNWGLWDQAMATPASEAQYVIALEGDAVWRAVQQHPQGLEKIAEVHSEGQPAAVLYRSLNSR
jgi:4-amino-4-deoxy-L-arabinose transferase-like glycosyltransferase